MIQIMNKTDKLGSLLQVFEALLSERNVSRAAERLHLSQPAMSHALARLREALGDELFVRTARGMTPTPRALALAPQVRDTLGRLQRLFAPPPRFDPATTTAQLTLASTEFFEQLLLPRLVPLLLAEAPRLTLRSRSTLGQLPKEDLERGDCDLAIAGFFGELPEGFYQQMLFVDDFVCVVRRDHPRVQKTLSLPTYLELDHLLISMQGDLKGVVDVALAKKRRARRVVAGVSSFLTPGWIIAGSDLVLTVPRRLAAIYQAQLPLRVLPVPLKLPPIKMVQVWHERTHGDALHRWFRRRVQLIVGDST